MYKLSVIIPVYNCEEYLPACLDSLVGQTAFGDMQVVLVDDGSADGSWKICDDFAAANSNAVSVRKANGGVSSARNAGLDRAEGEFVGFVDADDTVAPDYYENLLSAAEKNGCDMAFGGMTFVRADGMRECPPSFERSKIIKRENIAEDFARKMLTDGLQNSACVKILRRAVIETNKIRFPVGVKIAEDKLFILEFLRHSSDIVCAGGCGYLYRDVQTSAMHSGSKMALLMAVNEAEVEAFTALGLDEKTVRTEKAVFIFTELADYLGREYCAGRNLAKAAAKEHFENAELMAAIEPGIEHIKSNTGKIYSMLADAFAKKSVAKTLAVLFIQKKINERGA